MLSKKVTVLIFSKMNDVLENTLEKVVIKTGVLVI
jgi:hypothetical protein